MITFNPDPENNERIAQKHIPLQSVDITGDVLENFYDIVMRQRYRNDGPDCVNAVYSFPLPDDASVYGFKAKFSGREFSGEIMGRDRAREVFDNAMAAGDSAAHFEQYRPNAFAVTLGRIKAGETVDVEIRYLSETAVSRREMRFAIPLVVAPRYFPAADDSEKTPSSRAKNEKAGAERKKLNPPQAETEYRVTMSLNFDCGSRAADIESPSHYIAKKTLPSGGVNVIFGTECAKMDRDLVLVAKLPFEKRERFLTGVTESGERFAFATIKPRIPEAPPSGAREYVFLIDRSASMGELKMEQAKRALKICLRNLNGEDTFNIIAFNESFEAFSTGPVPYHQRSLIEATAWVEGLYAWAGTIPLPALKAALEGGAGREKIVLFVTDGAVGNEEQIIGYVKNHAEKVKIFAVGVDTAPNSYLINGIAAAGNGRAEFIFPGENVEDKVLRHFSRINDGRVESPYLEIDGAGRTAPARALPASIFTGDRLSVVARMEAAPSGEAAIYGKVSGGGRFVHYAGRAEEYSNPGMLARIWARQRIGWLEEMACGERFRDEAGNESKKVKELEAEALAVSLKYGVISKQSAFAMRVVRKNKDLEEPETIVVPVEMPAGWCPAIFYGLFSSSLITIFNTSINKSIDDLAAAESFEQEKAKGKLQVALGDGRLKTPQAKFSAAGEDHNAEAIKRLVLTQNADGSFGPNDAPLEEKLKNTLEALKEFSKFCPENEMDTYRRIIDKAMKFIERNREVALDQCELEAKRGRQ